MLIDVLNISFLLIAFLSLSAFRAKRKPKSIRIPKNHNDTTGAEYAVNEKGYLERIEHSKLSKHAN